VVVQALGRVRFATQPRLVISFQKVPLDYPLNGEFRNLNDLRRHFNLLTRRQWRAGRAGERVTALAAGGMDVAGIMATTGLSRSSVYEMLRPTRPANPKKISPKG